MTDMKHTPLPWFAVNAGTKNEPMMSVKAARIAGRPPSHEVAICATGDSCQEMENANAAFIARACNSHYALVDAVNDARSLLRAFIWPDDELGQNVIAMCDVALAKARGEA